MSVQTKKTYEIHTSMAEELPYIHNKAKADAFWENKLGAVAI